jgi:hypothetical protein
MPRGQDARMSLVAMAFDILRGTPWWVFLLAAVLVWLGLRSLRPRVTTVVRVLVTPTVFIAWGLASLIAGGGSSTTLALVWLLAAVAGVAFAALTVRMKELLVDRVHRLVLMPASPLPLVRNVLVFSAKYALAVAAIMHPEARGQFAVWDVAVSGASAGYFFGWVVRFTLAYRKTAIADLTMAVHTGGSPSGSCLTARELTDRNSMNAAD